MDDLTPSAGVEGTDPGSEPSPSSPAPAQDPSLNIDKLWEAATATEDQSTTTEEAPAEDAEESTVEEKPAETEEEPAEAKPGEGKEEGKEPKEPEKTEEQKAEAKAAEQPVVEPVVPARIKDAIATLERVGNKDMARDVKNQFYALAGFREQFQTPGEARAYRELVSDLEEAKNLVQSREQLQNFDYGYANDPVGLVHGLHRNSPRQLENLLSSLPTALAGIQGEDGQPDHRAFRIASAVFVRSTLANLREKRAEDNPDLAEAIEMVEAALGVKGKPDEDEAAMLKNPKVQALMRESEQNRQQAEKAFTEQVRSFAANVDSGFQTALVSEIGKFLAPVFKGAAFSDGAKAKIVSEIIGHIEEEMGPWAKANLDRMLQEGKFDKAHLDAAVNTYLGKARPLLRSSKVKGILTEWTRDILGSNRKEISRREQIASRRDVGAGGHAGVGPGSQSLANKPISEMTSAERAKYYETHSTPEDIWKDGMARSS